MKQSIGDFLLRRLEEVGVKHIFGVPGDYNLELMQQLEDRGEPAWIGNCNELNASYATDAYARLNGIGAMIVTNGVGALSAINGTAGAYSEHVPVVCVCGTIPLKAVERGDLMHHTLADREKGNFYRAFAEVTVAQSRLTPGNSAGEIDRLILTAWRRKLPVYMELPSDIAYLEIEVPGNPLKLEMVSSDRERLESCAGIITERLKSAKSPAFLLDLDADRFGLSQPIRQLAESLQMNVATMTTSKGVFPETSPLFAGIYKGRGSTPETRRIVEESDCLIAVGYRRVETVVGFFTDRLPNSAIYLNSSSVDVEGKNYQGVQSAELLQAVLASAPSGARQKQGAAAMAFGSFVPSKTSLRQDAYWEAMQRFIRPGDVIVAEDGTSSIGAGGMILPEGCTFISQAVWQSIGYATPALLGAILASPQRRHILFTGEGSLQLTAQEISTILRHDLKPLIFIINNHGYTIERAILGKDAKYNDVANWRYSELPNVFSREKKVETFVVQSGEELQKVLDSSHSGPVLVESVMDKHDAPVELIRSGHALGEMDYGPRGPQSRPDAELALPKSA